MGRNYANRLIGAVGVIDNLGPIGPKPQAESQARPLTQLDSLEDQQEAWQGATEKAAAKGRKVTARDAGGAAGKKRGTGEPPTPVYPCWVPSGPGVLPPYPQKFSPNFFMLETLY